MEGLTHDEIGAQLGIGRRAAGRLLARVNARHERDFGRSRDEHVARALARLERLWVIVWNAWEESKRPQESRRRAVIRTRGNVRVREATGAASSPGDPRYLLLAIGVIAEQNRVLGLAPGRSVMLTALRGRPLASVSDAELLSRIARRTRKR